MKLFCTQSHPKYDQLPKMNPHEQVRWIQEDLNRIQRELNDRINHLQDEQWKGGDRLYKLEQNVKEIAKKLGYKFFASDEKRNSIGGI